MIARLLFLLFVCVAPPAFAQTPDSSKLFDDAREQIADIRKQLAGNDIDDAKFEALRGQAAALVTQADALIDDRTPKLAALEARLKELGPAPASGASEPPDIAAQRKDLGKQSADLDAEIKSARVLVVEGQQVSADIVEGRRVKFQATLSERESTPLSPAFWTEVSGNLSHDTARFAAWRAGITAALRDSFAPDNRLFAFGGLAVGIFLIVFGRWGAERALMRLTTDRVPHGRLRRSALAFAVVVVATAFTGFGARAIVVGLDWHDGFSDAEKALAKTLVFAVVLGGYVAGLGRALLSATRPSWRLAPIPDAVAQRLRFFPVMLGSAVALSITQRQINSQVSASVWGTILSSLVIALLYASLIGWALVRVYQSRSHGEAAQATTQQPSIWVGLGITTLWIGVGVTLAAALTGYIAFAQVIARQMVGIGLVTASLYLLVHLLEDVCATAFSSRANWAQKTLGIEPRLLDQFNVLCSGVIRVGALIVGLFAALRPFGSEPLDLIAPISQIGGSLPIGDIKVTPSALGIALIVFVFGLLSIRAVQRWLLGKYLPTTQLDPGMRSSVTSLLGYVGGVVVFAFALSALGLSVEKIAWVASALSVGIGFGLQAVVQNFVSGLILLIERPVKVGDWVVLGDAEGDIRRINVRATEIQMADRSTVIVPNSELITKSVRNVTLANADGRVRLRLAVPLDSDAERVRDLMLAALAAHAGVLHTPEPSVLLDGIDGGSLILIATAYIDSPRQAGNIRSDLLFDLLARLRKEGIALAAPYDVKLSAPNPASAAAPQND